MTQKLTITYTDYVKCTVHGLLPADLDKVVKKFRLFVPTAKFIPSYQMGIWDGYISYFSVLGSTYINLIPEILSLINKNNYDIEIIVPSTLPKLPDISGAVSRNFLSHINWYKGHRLENQPIILEEHQVRVINSCLLNPRSLVDAATSSGKTLICAALIHKIKQHGKTILIVPSSDLCEQTAQELKYFGLDVGIVGMGRREFDHNVLVCTWQTINSISKQRRKQDLLSPEELNKLVVDATAIIFDETHLATSTEVQKICSSIFKNVPIRWGLTGTIPKRIDEYYCLKTSIGEKVVEVTTKELQDKGFVADCNIFCFRLEDKTKFETYAYEAEYLNSDSTRLDFIATILNQIVITNNNLLVLVPRINMGKQLESLMKEKGCDNVIFINGQTKSKKRLEEYQSIAESNNKCIIATAHIASTGLNIPRIFNLAFVDIGKSFTRVVQSIGRGLRLAKDKDYVNIFDISSTTKYSKRHFVERIHYYTERKHKYEIKQFPQTVWQTANLPIIKDNE